MRSTQEILKSAKAAVPALNACGSKINDALIKIADMLCENSAVEAILSANAKDIERAEGISEVMKDRLRLDKKRILGMADGIRGVAALPSPLGRVLDENVRPNGLTVKKISVSMGVVAIIYESRPNVTSDAAALALKSGNVCILRGGKEAYLTSAEIVKVIRRALALSGLPEDAVNLIEDTTRASATELMRANGYVDMLIPRGGAGLIRACIENATVPCIQTGTGICHVYVDGSADIDMALDIIENAKTSRPSVCNAAEVCLVDSAVAEKFLPLLKERLSKVELRLDEKAQKIIDGVPAGENDFDTEFLDYVLAVGVVDGVEEAVKHIAAHSTSHSEAIIANDEKAQEIFTSCVDSAAVYVNASTRFTDGGEFGFGCEMGISTQKLHARGPMGLPELTTYKYVITGNGQVRK
ncbi:MAG: glutamate-5-semialdehyde dehydrogenase [Clostridia bacterium]|nr:glutamate-5-semialdehyde dehydrogenase [Clostridia bacterium]